VRSVKRSILTLAVAALSLVACAKIAGLENSGEPNESLTGPRPDEVRESGAGPVESPSHLEGDVTIEPSSLDFEGVPCGEEAPTKDIVIKNTTDAEIDYEVTAPEASGFLIKGTAKGKVAPKGSVSVPISALTSTATDLNGGIVVNAGKSFLEVLTHARGMGGVLEFVPGNTLDFGQVRINQTGQEPVLIKNAGTGPLTITGFDGTAAGIDIAVPTPVTIAPNGTATLNATYVAGATVRDAEATLKPKISTKLCAVSPDVKARGTTINTFIGISSADFGAPACNTQPANREITISNFSPNDVTITAATFPGGSRFSNTTGLPVIVPKANGANPGTSRLALAVQATGTVLGVTQEELTLALQGADTATVKTNARVDVRGAVLEILAPNPMDFRSNGSNTDNRDFRIRNNGNMEVTIEYNFVRTMGAAAWFPDRGQDRISAGNTANISMGFRPSQNGEHRATLTPERRGGGTICNATMPVATARGNP